MTSDHLKDSLIDEIIKGLIGQGSDGLKPVIELLMNAAMKIEREHFLGAGSHQRTEERRGYANGYKPKELQTRLGGLELEVPQVRGLKFYPQSLEKGSRSEKALKLAVAEMYLQGVSTRRVSEITEKLCGCEVSSSQVSRLTKELDEQFEQFRTRSIGEIAYLVVDAVYLKIRHNGSVIDMAILLTYGINLEGKREILGASASYPKQKFTGENFLRIFNLEG